jgi:hypothetical protein
MYHVTRLMADVSKKIVTNYSLVSGISNTLASGLSVRRGEGVFKRFFFINSRSRGYICSLAALYNEISDRITCFVSFFKEDKV